MHKRRIPSRGPLTLRASEDARLSGFAKRLHRDKPLPARGELRAPLLVTLVFSLRPRNDVGTREPAVEVDVLAAPGAERRMGLDRRLAANRTRLAGVVPRCGVRRLRRHSTNRTSGIEPA